MSAERHLHSEPDLARIAVGFVGPQARLAEIERCTELRERFNTDTCFCKGGAMEKYADLRAILERLNDPEARFELGEDARRAQLASLADQYLLELLDGYERLERVLYPTLVPESADVA